MRQYLQCYALPLLYGIFLVLSASLAFYSVHNYLFYPFDVQSKGKYLFTFAHITDSQFSKSSPIFEEATTWLAKQENITFVVHTGDIVGSSDDITAWKNAYKYMHLLDGSSNWTAIAGSHDVERWGELDLKNYKEFFGEDSINHYFIVKDKLLFILLSWTTRDGSIPSETLNWMDKIIENHTSLYTIVCLHAHIFNFPLLNFLRVPNAEEIWNHVDKHSNIIAILSGHIHNNWVKIRTCNQHKVWSICTAALRDKGYIRLFNVYDNRIEVQGYSAWANRDYLGPLDRFTIELNSKNHDVDGDLWNDNIDIMPTNPLIPNMILFPLLTSIFLTVYWARKRRARSLSNIHTKRPYT